MPIQSNHIDSPMKSSAMRARRSLARSVPILTYHNVGPARPGVNPLLTVSPERFSEQLSWLARHSYSSITTSDWISLSTEGRSIPNKSILITFDDGYEDIERYALPVLSRYGFKAVVYVVTGLIGKKNEWDMRAGWGELRLMKEDQIIEWATKGIEFGSHTRNHPDLRTLTQTELEDELLGSAADLQKILGRAPTSFAYPFGHFNQTVRDCVAQVYQTAVTVVEAISSAKDDPILLPRLWTRPDEGLSAFGHRVKYGKVEPIWKAGLRRIPGVRGLRRRYLSSREQYRFLSRIARERYARPEVLFDEYQEDYSHDAPLEQERYQLIIDELTRLRSQWGDALEIGCSKGLFTAKIATICNSVLACDISPLACKLTSNKCVDFPNVKVEHFDIQRERIVGEYDLVFVMDTLAYIHGRRGLTKVINKLVRVIRVGGMLVFSEVRFTENIQKALWQHWIPEGADQHVLMLEKRGDLRLTYHNVHRTDGEAKSSYIDHLVAIFAKIKGENVRAG